MIGLGRCLPPCAHARGRSPAGLDFGAASEHTELAEEAPGGAHALLTAEADKMSLLH
jgi:hypothetical protein